MNKTQTNQLLLIGGIGVGAGLIWWLASRNARADMGQQQLGTAPVATKLQVIEAGMRSTDPAFIRQQAHILDTIHSDPMAASMLRVRANSLEAQTSSPQIQKGSRRVSRRRRAQIQK